MAKIRNAVSLDEFRLLGKEGGFTDPNEYISVDLFKHVLKRGEFPEEGFYEYQWAINECEFGRLQGYSVEMQIFLSSLYVYCNKRKLWGVTADSDYYYLAISLVVNNSLKTPLALEYLSFLEWLQDTVEPDVGYEDYYCLLTWVFLRRLTETTNHPQFKEVMRLLLAKNLTQSEIECFTDSERGMDAWIELNEIIPCPVLLKESCEQIVWGR